VKARDSFSQEGEESEGPIRLFEGKSRGDITKKLTVARLSGRDQGKPRVMILNEIDYK